MDQNNFNNQNNTENLSNQESIFTGAKHIASSPETATSKKGKKKIVVAIICLIIVAALAVGGYFAYNCFKNGFLVYSRPVKVNQNHDIVEVL